MSTETLLYQVGEHPDQLAGEGHAWAAPDTLLYQAAKLILADRAAIQKARKARKPLAA